MHESPWLLQMLYNSSRDALESVSPANFRGGVSMLVEVKLFDQETLLGRCLVLDTFIICEAS